MSKNRCPECGSDNVLTERRPDGFHGCLDCLHRWKIGESQPNPTLFDRITASEEVLAPYFVRADFDEPFLPWFSILTNESFETHEEAIAATVAKLKEVCDD